MTAELFEQIERASEGDEVAITLDTDTLTVGSVEFASPIVTRVAAVTEETIDARQKDVDIDGIVDRRVLRLVPCSHDTRHEAYIVETQSPVVGDDRVLPLRMQRRSGCGPADDLDSLSPVADIESIEVRS